jgi:hypothetical protein
MSDDDPLKLVELFQAGEAWLPSLETAIVALPEAPSFIGRRPRAFAGFRRSAARTSSSGRRARGSPSRR